MSEFGLVSDQFRRQAWPILLEVDKNVDPENRKYKNLGLHEETEWLSMF